MWYVGLGAIREAFKSDVEPTFETHGDKYPATWGPFRTKRGAEYGARYGGNGNPHLVTVDETEYYAKLKV